MTQPLHIIVESGHPQPYIKGTYRTVWDHMEPGESFLVPDARQRVAALTAGQRCGHKVVSERNKDGEGFRIWLISKKEGDR